MTVRMVVVGRLFRQLEAQQGDDGAGSVGEVVHGIGSDGHGAGNGSHQQLHGAQQHIGCDANAAAKPPHPGAIPLRVRFPDKYTNQKFSHSFLQ